MNGVTGRMGYRQHLVRSILAIREQGGLARRRRAACCPSRSSSAATRPSCASSPTGTASPTGPPTSTPRSPTRAARSTSTPRSPRPAATAITQGHRGRQAHLHREADRRDAATTRSSWPRLAAGRRASSTASCRTSSSCRACSSSSASIDGGFFGRILSVRGEFGYWVFEGDWQDAQRPSWNYRAEDGGGIVVDMFPHWHYVLEDLFGRVESVYAQGGHAHPDQRGTSRAAPTRPPPTTPRTAIFELEGGVVAQINSSWAVRVNRDELVEFQVDGTARQRRRRPARLPRPAPRRHPQAGLEPRPAAPRLPRPVAGGAGQRRVRQRLQGPVGAVPAPRRRGRAVPRRTSSPARAACSSPSSACSPRRGPRIEVPELSSIDA